MRHPIAGVAPPELDEATATVVWPSIGAYGLGRLVGRLSAIRAGYGFFTLGKVMALLTIPLSLAVYIWKILPYVCRRYRLTNRRIVIQKGYSAKDAASIGLDQFDSIEVQRLPGQEWLRCGETIFLARRGAPEAAGMEHAGLDPAAREVLRLSAVPRPEVFCQVCLEARTALLAVREALRQDRTA
jgi:hypothetical protein